MATTAKYSTPARGRPGTGSPPTKASVARAKAVDLVTGKTTVEYFFDPSQILDENTNTSTVPFKTPSKRNINSNDSAAANDPILYSSKHLFVPCTIVKSLTEDSENEAPSPGCNGNNNNHIPTQGPALVKTQDGSLYKVRDASALTSLTAPDDYIGVDDVLHLANVTEASLLHTLRLRYKREDIYTSAGPILISINPYRQLVRGGQSLYSPSVMMQYRSNSTHDGGDTEPHLFQVADRAYTAMMDSVHTVPHLQDESDADHVVMMQNDDYLGLTPPVRNQSIIISGESGAGKTEATKYIMQYLARITQKKYGVSDPGLLSPDGKIIAALEDRVLSSNPLLESFGNAQTLRNDNSSRFGKFIHINFSTKTGSIVGARISNYLLEKTRITTQMEGERNYHIFYQLFAGADPKVLAELGLEGGSKAFKYLGCRTAPKTKKDASDFEETTQCLARIGLTSSEQTTVFALAAAVLHIGNVTFEEKEDHSAVIAEESLPSLQKACALLGLAEGEVEEAILTKLLSIGGKTIKKPSTVAMAEDKRDALAKMTYSSLFLWLVQAINETLCPVEDEDFEEKKLGFIGVLDIYGFECFETNGYEQMLINYCNEKLQRHFNKHLFEVEQSLYSTEGVDWTYISFNDNRPCLELIEGGSGKGGILNTLDDAYAGMGSAEEKDVKFVSQLHKLFGSVAGAKQTGGGHDYFVTPKFANDRQFIVVHYAGEVRYTADGFVEKNMESLSNELKDLGESSTVELAKAAYACSFGGDDGNHAGGRRSSIRGFSVASQFKLSLQSLVEDLEHTQPHYIRCVKPNLKKAPNSFSSGEVLKQLRYSGMMEAIRIRREGYALREPHQSFYNRFCVLLGSEDPGNENGIEQLVKVLSKRLKVTDADWQIGHSKIFLRRKLSEKLERLANLRVHAAARTLGRFGKCVAYRNLSRLLVAWIRFRLKMLTMYRKRRAATSIAATYRRNVALADFRTTKARVVRIQSLQRQRQAERTVRKLRDPYYDMDYKQLKALLKTEKLDLEKVVSEQNFRAAADLENKIETIAGAMEARKPMTRRRLEEKIEKVQGELDDALSRKAYTEAGPLQERLEILTTQRKDLPTLEELREALNKAEVAVATAAKNRDFASAGALQSEVDQAKMKLEAALDAENSDDEGDTDGFEEIKQGVSIDGIECRADLERELADLRAQVEAAIAEKSFQKASTLQSKIDEREKLRLFFPSVEELEEELRKSKEKLESAIAARDFGAAGKLHESIDKLEALVRAEREKEKGDAAEVEEESLPAIVDLNGEKKEFTSRFELEGEIKATKVLQSEAVKSKQFRKAEQCQSTIDQLEALRICLPTVSELAKMIKEKKMEMNKAISAKRFSDAERLDRELSKLEEKLAAEKEKNPGSLPSSPANGASIPVVATTLSSDKPMIVSTRPFVAATPARAPDGSVSSTPLIRNRAVESSIRPATVAGSTPMVARSIKLPSAIDTPNRVNGDASDVASVLTSGSAMSKARRNKSTKTGPSLNAHKEERQVSVLRPKAPLVSSVSDNVLEFSRVLAKKRGNAAIVVGDEGGLAGILTDTDITRRLVAKDLDASTTKLAQIMTPDPTCVAMSDSAMDAMTTMVENHFRHLPVVDENGGVCGLLDIAKCLNDAISKLEKSQSRGENTAKDVLKQAVQAQGSQGVQAAALQALLGPLMAQAFGSETSPTLRSILDGRPSTLVAPGSSLKEVALVMSETRKPALVVENEELVGIFGFRDMMTRVVAKELPVEHTDIADVMTPNPEAVSPDMTVLEAMQIMHDTKFLTLPVCEENGKVVGLVDVMDVIYGCGGVDGWRSVFSSSLELDDLSDTASQYSGRGSTAGRSLKSTKSKKSTKAENPVSKLRPKKPLISSVSDSVLGVAQMLASKRGDAALVVSDEGGLAGIITDTDVTRRVVAKHLDPASTSIDSVMTPNPTCVAMADSAMDAMSTMVENHFRHLPVIDESGGVCGLLDIAKCLNDAISKLEKSKAKGGGAADDVLKQAMKAQGAQGAQAAALQALLGPLMAQAFGTQTSPTLRSLLAGKPSTIVEPSTNVLDAAVLMAESRKAALVVEDGSLVGIFGFKDMMNRVVAKELPFELTPIMEVMTPNPEAVSPDMTVLDALQTMHDNRFLTLPVCEEDGTVVGLVDVMDVVYGCGGAEGWRSVFSSSLELDDLSDNASHHSGRGSAAGSATMTSRSKKQDLRSVKMLRPKKALVCMEDDSILEVSQFLGRNRSDAAIVVSSTGRMAGIITDTDLTRRVVAKHVETTSTSIADVMTPDPTCVMSSDTAMDAMMLMIENHFRHLPVADDDGGVMGVLDIAKCLNDAISKLEKSHEKMGGSAEALVKQALKQSGGGLEALLGPLVSQAFGGKASRTLGSILSGKPTTVVRPETSVISAAMLMSDSRKAALVVDNGDLVGIFGFKDMMTRVIAQELDVENTCVEEVMTPSPEHVSPNMTVLEALQTMHDNRFLTLPVCEDNGTVVGLVDVMDVIYACGGVEGWRALFDSALDIQDEGSEQQSTAISASKRSSPQASDQDALVKVPRDARFVSQGIPGNIPTTLEFEEGRGLTFDEGSLNDTFRMDESHISEVKGITFKVIDPSGHTHRLKSECKLEKLKAALSGKVSSKKPLRFKFVDDEGDAILITSDEDLIEAVKLSRASVGQAGKLVVKLTAEEVQSGTVASPTLLAGVGAAVAIFGLGAMVLLRPRR